MTKKAIIQVPVNMMKIRTMLVRSRRRNFWTALETGQADIMNPVALMVSASMTKMATTWDLCRIMTALLQVILRRKIQKKTVLIRIQIPRMKILRATVMKSRMAGIREIQMRNLMSDGNGE